MNERSYEQKVEEAAKLVQDGLRPFKWLFGVFILAPMILFLMAMGYIVRSFGDSSVDHGLERNKMICQARSK